MSSNNLGCQIHDKRKFFRSQGHITSVAAFQDDYVVCCIEGGYFHTHIVVNISIMKGVVIVSPVSVFSPIFG